jgi:hypothetical protein
MNTCLDLIMAREGYEFTAQRNVERRPELSPGKRRA